MLGRDSGCCAVRAAESDRHPEVFIHIIIIINTTVIRTTNITTTTTTSPTTTTSRISSSRSFNSHTCECWAATPAAAPLGPQKTIGTRIIFMHILVVINTTDT